MDEQVSIVCVCVCVCMLMGGMHLDKSTVVQVERGPTFSIPFSKIVILTDIFGSQVKSMLLQFTLYICFYIWPLT